MQTLGRALTLQSSCSGRYAWQMREAAHPILEIEVRRKTISDEQDDTRVMRRTLIHQVTKDAVSSCLSPAKRLAPYQSGRRQQREAEPQGSHTKMPWESATSRVDEANRYLPTKKTEGQVREFRPRIYSSGSQCPRVLPCALWQDRQECGRR